MPLRIRKDIPLAPLTTFRVGGPARGYIEAGEAQDIMQAYEYAEERAWPLYLLGGGSNVLFSDRGFPGLVVHLKGGTPVCHGERIEAGAGTDLQAVVQLAADGGLGGIEKIAGIPGSFGGAVRGNAGAFGTELKDVVVSVNALELSTGLVRRFAPDECRFSYRNSLFKQSRDWVILSAELRLVTGQKPEELRRIGEETIAARERKHPQKTPSAGSFFMNPVVPDRGLREEFERDNGVPVRGERLPAGWLIDQVGLRGKRIGGAQISPQHPNYLINTGGATAEDIVTLASLVKTRVRDELGVRLQEEVQYAGF